MFEVNLLDPVGLQTKQQNTSISYRNGSGSKPIISELDYQKKIPEESTSNYLFISVLSFFILLVTMSIWTINPDTLLTNVKVDDLVNSSVFSQVVESVLQDIPNRVKIKEIKSLSSEVSMRFYSEDQKALNNLNYLLETYFNEKIPGKLKGTWKDTSYLYYSFKWQDDEPLIVADLQDFISLSSYFPDELKFDIITEEGENSKLNFRWEIGGSEKLPPEFINFLKYSNVDIQIIESNISSEELNITIFLVNNND